MKSSASIHWQEYLQEGQKENKEKQNFDTINKLDRQRHLKLSRRASTGALGILDQSSLFVDRGSDVHCRHTAFCASYQQDARNVITACFHPSMTDVILPRSRSVSAPELLSSEPRPIETSLSTTPLPSIRPSQGISSHPDLFCESSSGKEVPEFMQLELEIGRVERICESWNNRHWNKVEAYLKYHLSVLNSAGRLDSARRVRHLLGICASYKAQWQLALSWFLSVIKTPVHDAHQLDCGEKAAFRWL